ncbi:MAG: diguanylate cyclase [Lachnospiraceae bacterium]|nr:diguanylate cyclase [Lachnospiraceae bacterium]
MEKYWLVIADDDVLCLRNAKLLLSGSNMRVSSVRSGRELLKFLEKNRPDLVLLDVLMPEMDGFETYQRIRAFEEQEERQPIPVIFLTGENDSEIETRGLKLGASDFIRKPFNADILLRRIQNIIANRKKIRDLTAEAETDHLTGFYNKAGTEERLTELCSAGGGMLMILDLDDFKLVNDLYGHEMGDKVLRGFADITRSSSRADDVLGRIGGDEFLVFFRNAKDERAVEAFSDRLNRRLREECVSLMGEDFKVPIGVSVGCVVVPESGGNYRTLFRLADRALYQVKQNGKHACRICNTEVEGDDGTEAALDLEVELTNMLKVCGERNEAAKAMWVGQDAFSWIYRFMDRYSQRYHNKLTFLQFGLFEDGCGGEEELKEAVYQFGCVLQSRLRRNDVITQNRSNCFFLLLPELAERDLNSVLTRVRSEWVKTGAGKGVRLEYAVAFGGGEG